MNEMFRCKLCLAKFEQAAVKYMYDDGASYTPVRFCPECGSENIERLEPCPTCDNGWVDEHQYVCSDCRQKNLKDLKEFVKRFRLETLRDMDEILEGEALENFL